MVYVWGPLLNVGLPFGYGRSSLRTQYSTVKVYGLWMKRPWLNIEIFNLFGSCFLVLGAFK